MGWEWTDADDIRRRLDQGADPERWGGGRPLHRAAVFVSPDVVADLAGRVADVDALENGVTALWEAVVSRKPDTARVLAAAGADPWRLSLGGWSPGRLSLAGPTPELFPVPDGVSLTDTERTAAQEAHRLTAALGEFDYDGMGLVCVAGIEAAEAVRRLEATPVDGELLDELHELLEDRYAYDMDESLQIIGVTSVPGGCVVAQPWGYAPSMPGVLARLSAGTLCYGLYANPESGNQGSIARNGIIEGSDLHPGGVPDENDTSAEVLASYLYQDNAVAYACAFASLRLTDRRAVTGPLDMWVELPRRDCCWSEEKGASDRAEPGDHGLGRSHGGLSTKVHLASDSHARPLALRVTAGQAGDAPAFEAVMASIRVPRSRRGRPRTARTPSWRIARIQPARSVGTCAGEGSVPSFRSRPTRLVTVCGEGALAVARQPSTPRHTSSATRSSGASTGSSSGAVWPCGRISSPSLTRPHFTSLPSSSGPAGDPVPQLN